MFVEEIATHNSAESCWLIIDGKVYDLTDFLDEHPGGKKIILKHAGTDATAEFDKFHPRDTLNFLAPECCIGEVEDPENLPQTEEEEVVDDSTEEERVAEEARLDRIAHKPDLSKIINLYDFEAVARTTMDPNGFAYYSSGTEDEITLRENHNAFKRVYFNPRVLVDVTDVDQTTTMLGSPAATPLYISATAMGKIGHEDGELALARAAGTTGIIQMVPNLGLFGFDEIVDAAQPDQPLWFQLYVNRNKEIVKRIVRAAETRGVKALFVTVDAPHVGKREKDMRSKFLAGRSDSDDNGNHGDGDKKTSALIDTALTWKDVAWFRSITSMKIVLKGIQTVQDAVLAVQHHADGIVISNHGGRQLETVRAPIEVLADVNAYFKQHPEILAGKQFEMFIDGGVRRGSDVLKAICLGARGVGLGRALLYAMAGYGQEGVEKAVAILKDEIVMCMRLLGVTSLNQLDESYVDLAALKGGRGSSGGALFDNVYEPMGVVKFKARL
ncbi:hypothetical protein BABINDRAFT_59190 [Babjeviella inositovora NRRL Y-12698]|uniref:L-lactate dehydrogenase (cytochrome) n=1 Tax=Babjeviella inositovora NRRL Y-12698 TaxID=984486 RepID=A0A1E3QYG4_9ASCO|nr:uncharacterized protein BABINDRAFT_59190 [Babjeviella inositovora NRRL Y-12698]ODQ82117.1 hypothetical protein BABINDRAFT_59190 [Babjeviella inositovora NRRL Y-12698]